MPELPEVETTKRGIAPHLLGQQVARVKVHQAALRWPVPVQLTRKLRGAHIDSLERRAKYLMLGTGSGTALIHLGMTGSLRVVDSALPRRPHDHVEMHLSNGRCLRFNDPRRFGAWLWAGHDPLAHPLLAKLGPEPLSADFSGDRLYQRSRGRKVAVKSFIMDASQVVGVGNIYASEALFLAGIHPRRPAGRIARSRYQQLAAAIRAILKAAIRAGGTTLRDFSVDGTPGYFAHDLKVYGRAGEACLSCGTPVRSEVIGQRSTFFCPSCQR